MWREASQLVSAIKERGESEDMGGMVDLESGVSFVIQYLVICILGHAYQNSSVKGRGACALQLLGVLSTKSCLDRPGAQAA